MSARPQPSITGGEAERARDNAVPVPALQRVTREASPSLGPTSKWRGPRLCSNFSVPAARSRDSARSASDGMKGRRETQKPPPGGAGSPAPRARTPTPRPGLLSAGIALSRARLPGACSSELRRTALQIENAEIRGGEAERCTETWIHFCLFYMHDKTDSFCLESLG